MDPDATLDSLRIALANYNALIDDGNVEDGDVIDAANELAAAVEALDTWLTNGGFPPKGWSGFTPKKGNR